MVIYKVRVTLRGCSRLVREMVGNEVSRILRVSGNTGWLFVGIPRQVRQDRSLIDGRLAWLGWLEVSGLQYSGVEGRKGQSKARAAHRGM